MPVDVESARDESAAIRRTRGRWASWILGAGVFAAVIAAVVHGSEEREFWELLERAEPWWIVCAVVLQGATYLARGEGWRVVPRAARAPLRRGVSYSLSFAELFVDQTLPTAGIAGTIVVGRALEQRGVPRAVVMAAVAVDYLGYYAASVVAVAAALAITGMEGHADPTVVALGALFIVFGIVFSAMILWLSGRRRAPQNALARIKLVRRAIALLANADRKLVRRARVVCESTCFQLAVLVLDAATVWVCIRALGANASVVGVFASYMLATTARAIGIVPGGLGIFEGASVVTLELAGVPAVAALSGTLLYRVLSYWLPMAPGAWFFHRAAKRESPAPLPTNEEAVRGAEATPASNRTRSSASGSA